MKKKLWLLVTNDEYELPLFVADSAAELARHVGVKTGTILKSVYKAKKNGSKSKYHSVDVDIDEDDPPV